MRNTCSLDQMRKLTAVVAFMAASFVVTADRASAQSLSDLQAILSACGNPGLSHQEATAQLSKAGWTRATKRRDILPVVRHTAAGLAYRSDKPWITTAKNMREAFLELAKRTPYAINKNLLQETAILRHKAGFIGFLIVDEHSRSDTVPRLVGRECHLSLPKGEVSAGLVANAAAPDRLDRRKLPQQTKAAQGQKFALSSYVRSIPRKGLGFDVITTEFLSLRLSR